jgi:hypothetical protein
VHAWNILFHSYTLRNDFTSLGSGMSSIFFPHLSELSAIIIIITIVVAGIVVIYES